MSEDTTTNSIEVNLDNFNQVVLEGSFNKPVLIDFWAGWCEPCKILTPLLEQIVASYQGELTLAKVDCDTEQEIVAQFGVRSLPTVILIKEGQPIDGLMGTQTESAIRQMLERHVPLPVEAEQDQFSQAQILYQQGQKQQAETLLKKLLVEDNTNMPALILYGRCLAEKGELIEAEAVLNSVVGDEFKQALSIAKTQLAFLTQARDLPSCEQLQAKLTTNPLDDDTCYQLAIVQLAEQHYEQAMEGLLMLFKRNRSYHEDLPRKTLIQLFELLGNDQPLVAVYRKKLYQALY